MNQDLNTGLFLSKSFLKAQLLGLLQKCHLVTSKFPSVFTFLSLFLDREASVFVSAKINSLQLHLPTPCGPASSKTSNPSPPYLKNN